MARRRGRGRSYTKAVRLGPFTLLIRLLTGRRRRRSGRRN